MAERRTARQSGGSEARQRAADATPAHSPAPVAWRLRATTARGAYIQRLHAAPAVHFEAHTSNEFGFVRCEIQARVGNILRRRKAAERDRRKKALAVFRRVFDAHELRQQSGLAD